MSMQSMRTVQDERMKFIFKSLVTHLHDFVRETSLTTEDWMTAIHFLTETGQKCTDIRQEFILLSDTLGVSALVDSMNNVKPPNATENTVLGPYHTEDAHMVECKDSRLGSLVHRRLSSAIKSFHSSRVLDVL
ncbi:Intradiol ring-cleavage dioxygenase [Mucidula mucida]|nr:Intradiol ring-cleavage dioxygenase [Mucidula mucida]